MKTIFALLLAMVVLTPATLHAQEARYVTTEQSRLRAGASTRAAIVAILGKETVVIGVGRTGAWVQVRAGSKTGYVHSSLLALLPAADREPVTPAPAAPSVPDAVSPPPESAPNGRVPRESPAKLALVASSGAVSPFRAFAGVLNGSGGAGTGVGAGAGYTWAMPAWPVRIRAQALFARFSQSESISSGGFTVTAKGTNNLIGVNATAIYEFRTSPQSSVHPYLLGGLGLYRESVTLRLEAGGESEQMNRSDSSLSLEVGGGLDLGRRFFVELRMVPFFSGGGSMIPLVAGMRF